ALKLFESKRFACECLKLDVGRHFEVCVCGCCRFFGWRRVSLEPAIQQTFRVRNERHEFRAGQQSRLTAHHQQSDENQHDAGHDLNLVQVPAEIFVETQKLVDTKAR